MRQTFTSRQSEQEDGSRELLARLVGGSKSGTLLASAARTANTASAAFDGSGYKGILVFLNVSAASGTGGLNIQIQYLDPVTGTWMNGPYAPNAPKTIIGGFVAMFGPGVSVGTNANLNSSLSGDRGILMGANMRVTVLHSDASSYTYSVGYELVQ